MKRALKILGVLAIALIVLLALLIVLGLALEPDNEYVIDGIAALLFGWIQFAARQLPLLGHHAREVALSVAGAVAFFTLVHAVGRWRRPTWRASTSARVTMLGIAVAATSAAALGVSTNYRRLYTMPWHMVIGGWGYDTDLIALTLVTEALREHLEKHDRYPTTAEGLAALRPFLREVDLSDAWGRPYAYHSGDGGKTYEIASRGADGELGTEDDVVHPRP